MGIFESRSHRLVPCKESQSLALIIYKIVDQQGVIRLIELILISLTLDIFNIYYVSIKSGEYQQNPSLTFGSMKNFAKQGIESYHILLYNHAYSRDTHRFS